MFYYSISTPPENARKPKVPWRFQGVYKWDIDVKRINTFPQTFLSFSLSLSLSLLSLSLYIYYMDIYIYYIHIIYYIYKQKETECSLIPET